MGDDLKSKEDKSDKDSSDDYSGWDYKKLHEVFFEDNGKVDLNKANQISLSDTTPVFNTVQGLLQGVQDSMDAWSKRVLGPEGTWQGAAADEFKDVVQKFRSTVNGYLEPLTGPPTYGDVIDQANNDLGNVTAAFVEARNWAIGATDWEYNWQVEWTKQYNAIIDDRNFYAGDKFIDLFDHHIENAYAKYPSPPYKDGVWDPTTADPYKPYQKIYEQSMITALDTYKTKLNKHSDDLQAPTGSGGSGGSGGNGSGGKDSAAEKKLEEQQKKQQDQQDAQFKHQQELQDAQEKKQEQQQAKQESHQEAAQKHQQELQDAQEKKQEQQQAKQEAAQQKQQKQQEDAQKQQQALQNEQQQHQQKQQKDAQKQQEDAQKQQKALQDEQQQHQQKQQEDAQKQQKALQDEQQKQQQQQQDQGQKQLDALSKQKDDANQQLNKLGLGSGGDPGSSPPPPAPPNLPDSLNSHAPGPNVPDLGSAPPPPPPPNVPDSLNSNAPGSNVPNLGSVPPPPPPPPPNVPDYLNPNSLKTPPGSGGPNDPLMGPDGKPLTMPDGTPLTKGPDGTVLGPNNRPLLGPDGNPLKLDKLGNVVDSSGKRITNASLKDPNSGINEFGPGKPPPMPKDYKVGDPRKPAVDDFDVPGLKVPNSIGKGGAGSLGPAGKELNSLYGNGSTLNGPQAGRLGAGQGNGSGSGGAAEEESALLNNGKNLSAAEQQAVQQGGRMGSGGMPMSPMGGAHGGQQGQQDERTTWLMEDDEDVWGSEPDVGPAFLDGTC